MLNVVAIQGRLVADPTIRVTASGKKVAQLRLACDRGRRDAAPAVDEGGYAGPAAPAAPAYSAGTAADDFALIEDTGDLPF